MNNDNYAKVYTTEEVANILQENQVVETAPVPTKPSLSDRIGNLLNRFADKAWDLIEGNLGPWCYEKVDAKEVLFVILVIIAVCLFLGLLCEAGPSVIILR